MPKKSKEESGDIVITPEEYRQNNYIIYNGKLKKISASSAYLFDMLVIKSEE